MNQILQSDVGKVGVVIIALVVAYQYGSCNTVKESEFDRWQDSVEVITGKLADSLEQEIQLGIVKADSAGTVADSLSGVIIERDKEIERLRIAVRPSIQPIEAGELPPVCNTCVLRLDSAITVIDNFAVLVDSLDTQIKDLNLRDTTRTVQILALQSSLSTAIFEADTLRSTLENMPDPPKPPRFLGLFRVSPNTSALIGAGVTAIVIALITAGP